ncbi:TIGR03086 family metal-binding protein [Streptomyces acidicola]|uniref:TIGR03086 family protein n=1 Tax=Streptomyces acidicola TaxID=2596892 RepID=A0A5N8WU49_9ACTN|nr:TIGR03086 family metal-binding protein [Streptomyces acidicola]MPY50799.1 TIGR03086 family protein [Streptomyces acidicola]
MPTNPLGDLDRLRHLDAQAVRDSVALVRQVTPDDLLRPTPCSEWTLTGLLAHMTAQHRGFAAAARGHGRDLAHWRVRPLAVDAAAAAAEYGQAAEQVIAAFATVTAPDRPFVLPELPPVQRFPAAQAIGFHLLDYVVHSWDVAVSLGLTYEPGPELLAAALPVAHAVPDGDYRLAPDSPFRPALPADDEASTLERILLALGRSPGRSSGLSPDRSGPSGDTAPGSHRGLAVRDTPC